MSMKPSFEHADLRVRRTHTFLWEAFMTELSERAFEDITVKDICERAMVHRTTFYKYYADKYALLEQGMQQMYAALQAEVVHAPPNTFSANYPPPYFVRVFEHVAEHQQFYKLMLCGEGIGRFQKLLKDYIAEQVSTKGRDVPLTTLPFSVPREMHGQLFAGAILSLLAWWLEHDMPLSPHQMAQYLLSLSSMSSTHAL